MFVVLGTVDKLRLPGGAASPSVLEHLGELHSRPRGCKRAIERLLVFLEVQTGVFTRSEYNSNGSKSRERLVHPHTLEVEM